MKIQISRYVHQKILAISASPKRILNVTLKNLLKWYSFNCLTLISSKQNESNTWQRNKAKQNEVIVWSIFVWWHFLITCSSVIWGTVSTVTYLTTCCQIGWNHPGDLWFVAWERCHWSQRRGGVLVRNCRVFVRCLLKRWYPISFIFLQHLEVVDAVISELPYKHLARCWEDCGESWRYVDFQLATRKLHLSVHLLTLQVSWPWPRRWLRAWHGFLVLPVV